MGDRHATYHPPGPPADHAAGHHGRGRAGHRHRRWRGRQRELVHHVRDTRDHPGPPAAATGAPGRGAPGAAGRGRASGLLVPVPGPARGRPRELVRGRPAAPGLHLDPGTGTLSGVPDAAGSSDVVVRGYAPGRRGAVGYANAVLTVDRPVITNVAVQHVPGARPVVRIWGSGFGVIPAGRAGQAVQSWTDHEIVATPGSGRGPVIADGGRLTVPSDGARWSGHVTAWPADGAAGDPGPAATGAAGEHQGSLPGHAGRGRRIAGRLLEHRGGQAARGPDPGPVIRRDQRDTGVRGPRHPDRPGRRPWRRRSPRAAHRRGQRSGHGAGADGGLQPLPGPVLRPARLRRPSWRACSWPTWPPTPTLPIRRRTPARSRPS